MNKGIHYTAKICLNSICAVNVVWQVWIKLLDKHMNINLVGFFSFSIKISYKIYDIELSTTGSKYANENLLIKIINSCG